MSDKDGGPAFPIPQILDKGSYPVIGWEAGMKGMSLRDWFAGMAMQGMTTVFSSDAWDELSNDKRKLADGAAVIAYRIADRMLAHRNATEKNHE